jgi:hypothetical protein
MTLLDIGQAIGIVVLALAVTVIATRVTRKK